LWLQPPSHAGSSHVDFSTLKMEAIRSYETSVHTKSTRRHIPEDGILQNRLHLYAVEASNEIRLEVNTEKTEYMLLSRH
jgi:hypothetical protein